MKIGKLPEPVLIRSVLKRVNHRRDEVLVGPAVGQDCAALCVGPDEALVMSADPITGTTKDIGSLSVYITTNDLAAAGAEPLGVMLTVMLPEAVEEPELRKMMEDVERTCAALNVEVLGGHTEITDVVKQALISVTGVGKIKKDHLTTLTGIEADQDLVVTKCLTSICLSFRNPESLWSTVSVPCMISQKAVFSGHSGRWHPVRILVWKST